MRFTSLATRQDIFWIKPQRVNVVVAAQMKLLHHHLFTFIKLLLPSTTKQMGFHPFVTKQLLTVQIETYSIHIVQRSKGIIYLCGPQGILL